MDKIVTATLVLQVTVKLKGESPRELEANLNDIIELAMNNGLITGESGMEVDDTRWHVLVGDEYEADSGDREEDEE